MTDNSAMDRAHAIRAALRAQVKDKASLEVPAVGDFGLFQAAPALTTAVQPVVIDANWLRDDVLRVCRSGQATVLVTGAVEHFLRPFVAPHVMQEVDRHAPEWASGGRVNTEQFRDRWRRVYQPLLRVVEPDPQLLASAEQDRIEALRAVDPDDIPSVTLAIQLRAPYVSTDRAAVDAVYGVGRDKRERHQMLGLLAERGTRGHLEQITAAGAMGTALAGMGVWKLVRQAASRWPAPSLAAAGLLAVSGYSNRSRWEQQMVSAARAAGEFLTAAGVVTQELNTLWNAELPPSPSWQELAHELPRRSVVARAVVHELARYGPGHLSAREMAERLPQGLGGVSDTTVRAELRRLTPATVTEVSQGRWQAGRPWCRGT